MDDSRFPIPFEGWSVSSIDNQRKHPRIPTAVDAVLEAQDSNYFALTSNVSEAGLFLRMNQMFSTGTRMRIFFGPPSVSRIEAHGEVKWSKQGEGNGIEFISLDPSDRLTLSGLLDPPLQS